MIIADQNKDNIQWEVPKTFGVGQFTDLRLYSEALKIANNLGVITANLLNELLPERVIGLKFVQSFKSRTSTDLIKELRLFGLIEETDKDIYEITKTGKKLLNSYQKNSNNYSLEILELMNSVYNVPGWFIQRLWSLNKIGQGQIVIPAPIKEWKPKVKKWEEFNWNEELENVCRITIETINLKLPNAFPIEFKEWVKEVRTEFERLGARQPKVSSLIKKTKSKNNSKDKVKFYSIRRRLSFSMKNATIRMIFSNRLLGGNVKDFNTNKEPINPRNFMVWCPRLESLELLFYTDYNTEIPGRILFPISVFRENSARSFYEIKFIKNNLGQNLFLHKPTWTDFKTEFLKTLYEVYRKIYDHEGIIYVSVQEVRDEVCRILRVSAATFEQFLQKGFEESVKGLTGFAIALETDIRDDQKNSYQMVRRGVYINGVPNSLIAIKNTRKHDK